MIEEAMMNRLFALRRIVLLICFCGPLINMMRSCPAYNKVRYYGTDSVQQTSNKKIKKHHVTLFLMIHLGSWEIQITMFVVKDSIHVNAPIERCFLLSTSLELVQRTSKMHLAGKQSTRTSGLVERGDKLLWRGWILSLPQFHESVITKYERPDYFQDAMARGRFKRFEHDHFFAETGGQTVLKEKVRFSLPLRWATRSLGQHIVTPHIARLLRHRLELLKRVAEGEEWKNYLTDAN